MPSREETSVVKVDPSGSEFLLCVSSIRSPRSFGPQAACYRLKTDTELKVTGPSMPCYDTKLVDVAKSTCESSHPGENSGN